MKLSSRGHYGLRAMVYLAKPKNNQPIPLRQIAADEKIPEAFLEQIFVDLRKAGLVKSVRGPKGGYRLVDSPEKIVVGNIVRVLEGTMNIVDCMEDNDGNCCDKNEDCSTKIVWEKLRTTMATVLDGMKLSDLVLGEKTMIDTL
ncbi:RrF2 family transcriptional regulator [Tepidibacillus fermentans]|uniref:BadM/Rrf2 family transcriptional regulator n=1 Tax=Tepidibacillus fermentans TaxID=1281767 RepID=A0A4R3KI14_9BACI|nr:Rrf2 family transcriptional regulator [Tepidibacillus fermentans]TCS83127.1 BadM/Rrf2 family transcriptional regulator [Tepidibacillus fermentans]